MNAELDDLFRVKKKHITQVVELFAKVFANDPMTIHMILDEEERLEFTADYFRVRIKYGIIYGEVYATSENFEGVAVWISPKYTDMTTWRMFRIGGMKLFRKVGKQITEKMMEILSYTSELHHKTIDVPHWHLSPIGVAPEEQGKGYASKLMKAMLKRLDAEKSPCFLETQVKKNVDIYKRYGFVVVDEDKVPNSNLPHWTMIREPI